MTRDLIITYRVCHKEIKIKIQYSNYFLSFIEDHPFSIVCDDCIEELKKLKEMIEKRD